MTRIIKVGDTYILNGPRVQWIATGETDESWFVFGQPSDAIANGSGDDTLGPGHEEWCI